MRRIMILLLAIAAVGAIAQEGGQRPPRPFPTEPMANPGVHDPVMARCDGKYYIFSTGMQIGQMTSTDLRLWSHAPHVMPEVPEWATLAVPGYHGHTWAPDIQQVGDTWYLYYSCSSFGKNRSAIGLMTNKTLNPESPDYKWEDQGLVVSSTPGITDWNAIDPNLILDSAGQPWLTWGSFWDGIQLVQLDSDFKTPKGEPKTIARRYERGAESALISAADLERANQAPEAGPNAIEAPFIIRNGDYYYLFASWDYCCKGADSNYKTVVGRSRDVAGPYLDRDGKDMASGGGTVIAGPDADYYGVGHTSAYQFDGQWYFMAHGYAASLDGASTLIIRKMHFDPDAWPILGEQL
ncbi:MAG: family 43 glycosylhydrolase [Bacteroidales bacterium]|nr:family 43 glycosylhydrolase [Bacteroidales bacterium]